MPQNGISKIPKMLYVAQTGWESWQRKHVDANVLPLPALSSTCFFGQLSHQRASFASSLINGPPLPALSSTCFLCKLSHQRASFASSLINVPPLPALSSTCLLCQLSHQRASFASSLINVLPLPALSSTCFLCQLSHLRASFVSSLINVLPLPALSQSHSACLESNRENCRWTRPTVSVSLSIVSVSGNCFQTNSLCRPRWLIWMRRPIGDQEVAGSTPAEVDNMLSCRLIVKCFLRAFNPFRWFKKGGCQFLAKKCAQNWYTA